MEISQNTIVSEPEPIELKLNDTHLLSKCIPVDQSFPYDLIHFSNSMTIAREKLGGVGLAANQVGINYRVVSIKGIDSCLFNPIIVYRSDDTDLLEEGCLSYPGLYVKVPRALTIRVRYMTAVGETVTKTYTHMTARVIQHEVDHLDGLTFHSRAHPIHRDRAMRKWKIFKRRNK